MILMTRFVVLLLLLLPFSLSAKTIEICTTIDGSGSMKVDDFRLETEGLARAIEDPTTVPQNVSVTISVVQFSSTARLEIAPTTIDNQATATTVATRIRAISQLSGSTNIPSAIDLCAEQFRFTSDKQIIDISTDGENNGGGSPSVASDRAIAKGVDVINALGIGNGVKQEELKLLVRPQPAHLFPQDGFVLLTPGFGEYVSAIKSKLSVETGTYIPATGTIELCAAMDGSGSMSSQQFTLQKEGLASAIEDPQIVPQDSRLTFSLVQFSSSAQVEIPPILIDSQATATSVATRVRSLSQFSGSTNIPSAIDLCTQQFGFAANKQVIDISTDGENTHGGSPSVASDRATAKGVDVINALGIGSSVKRDELNLLVRPQPVKNFPQDGFVYLVPDFAGYANAIKEKMGAETGTRIPGALITPDLRIRAVIQTVEKGSIEGVWQLGGDATTKRGDRVIWGYFYASPNDITWGDQNNPDIFVKVWFDISGRIDVNYFHVSVPNIEVSSTKGNYSPLLSTTSMGTRYVRHSFNTDGSQQGSSEPTQDTSAISKAVSRSAGASIAIAESAKINTVEKGLILGKMGTGGSGSPSRGDRVRWGYYYADPSEVSWGDPNNPDVFYKIWFDVSGRIDVNFFHVSVPDIEVYSQMLELSANSPLTELFKSVTSTATRYIRHEYLASDNVEGFIQDALTGTHLANALVNVSQRGNKIKEVFSGQDGRYRLSLPEGEYTLEISLAGYISATVIINVARGENLTVTGLRQVPQANAGNGTVAGIISNAFNGQPVENIAISVRKGINTKTGTIISQTATQSNGSYSIDLAGGNYTLELASSGYLTTYLEVVCVGGRVVSNQNTSITPIINAGEIRIVLNWGEKPDDLDSHLLTPNIQGKGYHLYYNSTGDKLSAPFSLLDVDDTSSYGPETITIYTLQPGIYRYAIHNFSAAYDGDQATVPITSSSAKVEVYASTGLVKSYKVPSTGVGRCWEVFSLNGTTGEITTINRISPTEPCEQVSN